MTESRTVWKDLESRRIGKSLDEVRVSVVATTRHSRTNDLTTSKALSRAIK